MTDIRVPIDKKRVSIPGELRYKWQTLLDIIVEILDVPIASITRVEPDNIHVFLYTEAIKSYGKLSVLENLVKSYCDSVVTTKRELLVTNTLKEASWKGSGAEKAAMISYFGLPLFWPDGDVFGAICVLDTKENHYTGYSKRLIAQFKELIETHVALLYQHQKLEALLESLGDIKESFYPDISADTVITTDNQDHITFWNRGAESLFGYTSAEILGKSLSLLIAGPSRKAYEDMRKLMSEDSDNTIRQVIEVVGVRKDDIEVPIELTYVHWKSKDTLSFTAIIRTTAKRKRLGEMIQIRNRELNVLNTIARSLSQSLKLDEVLHRGLATIIETLGMTAGAIYLTDEVVGESSLVANLGLTEDMKEATKEVPLRQQINLEQGQYAINLPLISRGKVLGSTLLVGESEFQDEYIQLLETASSHLAAAIDNACLFNTTEKMSITDGLTGLYNQRHFRHVLQSEVDRLTRYGGSLSLVMLDLDGFKEFNDQYGHVGGDEVLRSFAQALRVVLRKTDYAFRYGGDEFVVILPLTTVKKAEDLLQRVRKEWAKVFCRLQLRGHTALGFSAGIAGFPRNAETAESLLLMADAALYESKRQGKHKSTLVSDMRDTPLDADS